MNRYKYVYVELTVTIIDIVLSLIVEVYFECTKCNSCDYFFFVFSSLITSELAFFPSLSLSSSRCLSFLPSFFLLSYIPTKKIDGLSHNDHPTSVTPTEQERVKMKKWP